MRPFWLTLALIGIGGIGVTLSLAPFNLWPLAFISAAILHRLISVHSLKNALTHSFLFSFTVHLSGVHWVWVSMHDYGGMSPIFAGFATVMFCLFLAIWIIPFTWIYQRYLQRQMIGTTFGFAGLWFLHEWVRTWLFTGFPWLFIGYSQTEGPFRELAPILGVMGIGFCIALISSYLSLITRGHMNRQHAMFFSLSLAFLVGLLLVSKHTPWTHPTNTTPINAVIFQPNTPLYEKWNPMNHDRIVQTTIDQSKQHMSDRTLLVWPETHIPSLLNSVHEPLTVLNDDAKQRNTTVLIGIQTQRNQQYFNSLITLGANQGIYHKQKLVPFGEYIPFDQWLRGIIAFFDLPASRFSSNASPQPPLSVFNTNIAPFICYEITYPSFVYEQAKRSGLLLTISNDAWFGRSIGPIQHMQMAQMRALETGRYVLRANNTGISGIVDNNGTLLETIELLEQGVINAPVPIYSGNTPIVRYGLKPQLILVFTLIFLLLLRYYRSRKSNSTK